MKRLLLLGGGHTHVEVLRQFGVHPLAGVDIALASPARYAAYSGMLPGLIAGHYDYHDCHIDLERLAAFAGARFLQSAASSIDSTRREAVLADGTLAGYDIVSIDVGAIPAATAIAGVAEYAVPLKPAAELLQAWDALIARGRAGSVKNIVVVGGGAAGAEILLAMRYRLAQELAPDAVRFALVTDSDCLLPDHSSRARAVFQRVFAESGIQIHLGSRIVRVEPGAVLAADGQRIAADATVWAAGAAPLPQMRGAGLAVDANGFITVNEHLQSISNPEAYAAGDCATIQGLTYPKSGVYAVRQGPPLAENLRRTLTVGPLISYRPQPRALALISTGNKYAVASYGPLALHGAWVWDWKDSIDRRFVAKYNSPA